jgi:hypothetical protein
MTLPADRLLPRLPSPNLASPLNQPLGLHPTHNHQQARGQISSWEVWTRQAHGGSHHPARVWSMRAHNTLRR